MRTWKSLLRLVSIVGLLAGLLTVSGASASTHQPFSFTACNKAIIPDPSDPMKFTVVQVDFPDMGPYGKMGIEGETTVVERMTPPRPSGEVTLHLTIESKGNVYYDGKPVQMDGNLQSMGVGKGTLGGALSGNTKSMDSRVHMVAKWWSAPELNKWCADQSYYYGAMRLVGEIHVDPAK